MTSIELSPQPPYRDPSRSVDERVDDLLARMTSDEKVAQLGSVWSFELAEADRFSRAQAAELLERGIGHVTRISGATGFGAAEAARFANETQRFLVEQTRLGIPAIVHEEICSGLMARDAVVFPQALGLASTWVPELAEELAATVREQMRARGAHQGLSPVLDICRDPRWGRTEETFGEDPYLVARMGVAFVRGLQNADLREGVVATAKHFVGYGASDGGMNWAPARIGARELRDVYLHPFEAAVREAGLQSVMNAYNEIDGIPCGADHELLTDVLRDEWGFEGTVVSDYFSIRQLADYHRVASDRAGAAVAALEAGLDVELPGTDCYGTPLLDALNAGLVSEATVDTAVRRVLATKFRLGLFEQPYVDEPTDDGVAAHRLLARRIAEKSIVLLKNDGVLPLDHDASVALIGPNAHDARNLLGDYCYSAHIESLAEMRRGGRNVFSMPSGDAVDVPRIEFETVLDALRERRDVRYAPGCDIAGDDRSGFDEAVRAAASSDVAVLVLGDKAGLTDDCTSGESRDRANFDLPGVQEELAAAVLATGTPTLLVLVAGRPCGSAALHESCAAVVHAWLPGEAGGGAIADVLLGIVNPAGKLPLTYPHSVGQVPTFYGHKVSGGRSHWKGDYVDAPAAPLYPFGFGIGYAPFEIAAAALRRPVAGYDGSFVVDVHVANRGDRDGEEVVQLYVRDPHASVTRPVLELKAFTRVEVAAGATRQVVFEVPVAQLGFHDRGLRYVVESGALDVFVGFSSADLVEVGTLTVTGDADRAEVEKAFDGSVSLA
jgi:beta-xylosidase